MEPIYTIDKRLTKLDESNRPNTVCDLYMPVCSLDIKDIPNIADLVRTSSFKKSNLLTEETLIFYTGGLESVMCSLMLPKTSTLLNIKSIELLGHEIYEPALFMLGHYLGYSKVCVGYEAGNDDDYKKNKLLYNYTDKHTKEVCEEFLVEPVLPCIMFDKFTLFKAAIANDLNFYSCDNSDSYCGECFKCFQISTFYKAIGVNKIIVPTNLVERYLQEIEDYSISGHDKFRGDCWAFLTMEEQINRTTRSLWM